MKNTIRIVAGAVVALTIGLVLVPTATAQTEGEILALGWWTRLPTTSAPEGGFAVGAGIDGPNSVAAVQIDLGSGVTSLTIDAVEAGGVPDLAVMRACPAADGWTATSGGDLADAPEIDCADSVLFSRGTDGTWTADVTPLVAGRTGPVSIGFRAHGPSGDGPLGITPSEVQFEAPTSTATPLVTTPPVDDSSTPPPAVSPTPAPSFTPPPSSGFTVSPPTTGLQLTPVQPEEVAAPPTTAAAPDPFGLGAVTAADVGSEQGRPIAEAFVLILLAAIAGLAVGAISKISAMRAAA